MARYTKIGKDQEKLYDVEAVEGHRTREEVREYLVKWEGYSDRTWEAADRIEYYVPSKVLEYFKTTSLPMETSEIISVHLKWKNSDDEGFDVVFKNEFARVVINMTEKEVLKETSGAMCVLTDFFDKMDELKTETLRFVEANQERGAGIRAARSTPPLTRAATRRLDNMADTQQTRSTDATGDEQSCVSKLDGKQKGEELDVGQGDSGQLHDELLIIDTQFIGQTSALRISNARNLPTPPPALDESLHVDLD